MKNLYKILGATAFLSLLLVGSIVVAAPPAQQPEAQEDPEPLGMIGSDLVMIDLDKTILDQIKVTVKNEGPGLAWSKYTVHVHINGILNGDDDLENCRTILPGTTRTYITRPFVGGIIGRGYEVNVDYNKNVWEGFLGELNNRYTGIV